MPCTCGWFLAAKIFPVITFDASSRQSHEDIRKDVSGSILLKKSNNSLRITELSSSRARAQDLSFQMQRPPCPLGFSYDNACLLE